MPYLLINALLFLMFSFVTDWKSLKIVVNEDLFLSVNKLRTTCIKYFSLEVLTLY